MALNAIPCPSMWPGEEQPSLLDQGASLVSRDPAPGSVHAAEEELISTRPPRSTSKGDLVIVINEKMNSK